MPSASPRGFAGRALTQQIGGVDAKDGRDPTENGDRGVLLPTFNAAHVTGVDLRTMRQNLLRQPFGLAQPLYVDTDDFLPAHPRMSASRLSPVEEL